MFGDKLKELRKQYGISQSELGQMLGVSNTAIYSWEINRTQPPIDSIKKIADFFQVSTDYLLGIEIDGLEEIEQIKRLLKQSGLMVGDDLTMEELEKALKIFNMLKENK